jgi:hypothetical protein
MNTIPHHLGGDPEADLKLLYQRRKQLMYEREIARKGRQARRELDRQKRSEEKKRAKAVARSAASTANGTGAAQTRSARNDKTPAWSTIAVWLSLVALFGWLALLLADPLQIGVDRVAMAWRYAILVAAVWLPACFACWLWRRANGAQA